MIRFLQSKWLAALIGMAAYAGTTFVCWQHVDFLPAHSPDPAIGAMQASWNFRDPNLEQLLLDVQKQKQELAARDQGLTELAARLKVERQELSQVTQTMDQVRKQFDRDIVRIKAEEAANLKKLAKVYATMTPDNAAAVLKELDEVQLVRILVFMKENETAPILEAMAKRTSADAKRVAQLSERLRLAMFRDVHSTTKTP